MDNSLLVAQNKLLTVSNSFLFYSYQIIFFLLDRFGLKLEHRKTEVFHFLRSTDLFNLSSLNLSLLGGPILQSKNSWRYLDFIFNRKLIFCIHIDFYANKVISTVKYMKLLSNSTHGLISQQKCLLYRSYVLPITLYGFQLWFYNKTLLLYPIKELNKMQQRATIWILDVFCTLLYSDYCRFCSN